METIIAISGFGKSLFVAGAAEVFDDGGNLVDDKIRKLLGAYVEGFTEFALATRRTNS